MVTYNAFLLLPFSPFIVQPKLHGRIGRTWDCQLAMPLTELWCGASDRTSGTIGDRDAHGVASASGWTMQ